MKHRSPHVRFAGGANHPGRRPWFDMCCWPECDSDSVDESIPLCQRHHLIAWRTFEKMALWPLEELRAKFARLDLDPSEPRPAAAPRPNRKSEGHVYFIRLGNRVKIGFSTNLGSRFASLPHDAILGVMPGTFQDENRCHKLFAHLRATGEWFRAEPELLEFVAKTARPYVPPQRPRRPAVQIDPSRPTRPCPPPQPRGQVDTPTPES